MPAGRQSALDPHNGLDGRVETSCDIAGIDAVHGKRSRAAALHRAGAYNVASFAIREGTPMKQLHRASIAAIVSLALASAASAQVSSAILQGVVTDAQT